MVATIFTNKTVITKLSVQQISNISADDIANMINFQATQLTPVQIGALTAKQALNMTVTALRGILIKNLNDDFIKALTGNITGIASTNSKDFEPDRMQYLPVSYINKMEKQH